MVATLSLGVTALAGCTNSAASDDVATSTSQVLPYDADEATATREAMEADAYEQAEVGYRKLLEMTPDRDKPLPEEASKYATQRWIDRSNEFRSELYADGRYSEGETIIETATPVAYVQHGNPGWSMTVTPVAYVQHGNPGWSMTVDFCVGNAATLYEKDGTVSENQFATPDGELLKPGEESNSIVTVDYLHSNGIWRANASKTSAAESC